jgi:beta-glucosidase
MAAGIIPNATLNHWDLPQALQDEGGWAKRRTAEYFVNYARLVFDRLGDRVAMWATHNEPWVVAFPGYGLGSLAPGLADTSQAYAAAHHLLLSHGQAVQLFRQGGYTGEIGIVLNVGWMLPASESEADREACQRHFDQVIGLFTGPLFTGRYPEKLLEWLGPVAPPVEQGDMELIHQPVDFLGLNYYFTNEVAYGHNGSYLRLKTAEVAADVGRTEMGWGIYPAGLTAILKLFHEQYGSRELYIDRDGCRRA